MRLLTLLALLGAVGAAQGAVVKAATSASSTVVVAPSTAVLTDAAGNTWGISPAACTATWATKGATSVVTLNGVIDATTCSVVEIAYVNGVIWQENATQQWYSKTGPAVAWAGPVTASPVAVVSTATLTWIAPTAYTSGAAITGTLTYNVYQGVSGATLAKVQSGLTALTVVITAGLTAGTTQCFAVTAVAATVEGAQSTQACKAFAAVTPAILTPKAPTLSPVH